jgi:hypothetical protein
MSANTNYPPLVEYNNKKDFISLMSDLFERIDALASDDKINTEEYRQMADLCKQMYNIKEQVKTQVVYVEIRRATERKPPKPPKAEQEKLEAKSHKTCEYCDKRIHKKWLLEHQRTSATCLRVRQTKMNVNVLTKAEDEEAVSKPLYPIIQVMNISLAKRHLQKNRMCSGMETKVFAPITSIVQMEVEEEVIEKVGENEDGEDIMDFVRDEKGEIAKVKVMKPFKQTETLADVMVRWWSEVRPIGHHISIKGIKWVKNPEPRVGELKYNAEKWSVGSSWKMFMDVKIKKAPKKKPVLLIVEEEDEVEMEMMAKEDKDVPEPVAVKPYHLMDWDELQANIPADEKPVCYNSNDRAKYAEQYGENPAKGMWYDAEELELDAKWLANCQNQTQFGNPKLIDMYNIAKIDRHFLRMKRIISPIGKTEREIAYYNELDRKVDAGLKNIKIPKKVAKVLGPMLKK